jgi:DNA repair ATPase RecN
VVDRAQRILGQLESDQLSEKVAATLGRVDQTLRAVEATAIRVDRERVPERASKAFAEIGTTADRIDRVLERLDGQKGLIASMGRATEQFGQAGRGVSTSTRDLGQTLEQLRETAEAIRVLAEDLDRDPDMLVKGRARRSSR